MFTVQSQIIIVLGFACLNFNMRQAVIDNIGTYRQGCIAKTFYTARKSPASWYILSHECFNLIVHLHPSRRETKISKTWRNTNKPFHNISVYKSYTAFGARGLNENKSVPCKITLLVRQARKECWLSMHFPVSALGEVRGIRQTVLISSTFRMLLWRVAILYVKCPEHNNIQCIFILTSVNKNPNLWSQLPCLLIWSLFIIFFTLDVVNW